ncbi:MAG: hypothetical protein ACKOW8_13895, partial [Flavobacteriales bacterium]
HRKILKKISPFRVEYREARCTVRHQELYALQSQRFQSFIDRNTSVIFHNPNYSAFNTMEVAVFHDDKLIAYSLFDVGFHAMASLLCCFDKDYNDLSLGKATMLLELHYARTNGIKYYYPGYILDEPTKMDYKLFLGNFEYMNPNLPPPPSNLTTMASMTNGQNMDKATLIRDYKFYATKRNVWTEFPEKPNLGSSANYIKRILAMLTELLDSFGIQHKTWIYPLHYWASSPTTSDGKRVSWPLMVELSSYNNIFIAADQDTGNLVVFSGKLQSRFKMPNSIYPSTEFLDKSRFLLHLMVAEKILEQQLVRPNDNRQSILARLQLIISDYQINLSSASTQFAN